MSKLGSRFFTHETLEHDELYKMNFYNKFKLTLFSCLISQQIYALNLMPIDVQSAPGELLYAEIAFQHADPSQPLRVGLATIEDLNYLGIHHQPPGHLNFFVRQSSSDTGVITITSNRPVIETELNVVVRIQHAGATRLQHIKTRLAKLKTNNNIPRAEKSLVPIKIVREEEIALLLPTATQYQAQIKTVATTQERPLQVSSMPPPLLQGTALTAQVVAPATSRPIAAATAPITPTAANSMTSRSEQILVVQKTAPPPLDTVTTSQLNTASTQAESTQLTTTITPIMTQQHVVKSNESLWAISASIAKQHQLPISSVMKEIHHTNPHAFVGGNINKLRRGAILDFNFDHTLTQAKKVANKDLPILASKQSGKAKYRLNEAQMRLVAEKESDSAQGSAKKSTQTPKSSEQLALKVMTSREKSVKLQRNVTHLDQTLKQKDHRIQLLNTRLAQLQQQLKAQQVQKK